MLNEMDTFDDDNCDIPATCDVDGLNIDFDIWTNVGLLIAVTVGTHLLAIFSTWTLARKIRA
jgi:hypothetical protein